MPAEDVFERVITAIEGPMHQARHMGFAFPANVNEHPLIDMGWNGGMLFGIHFACQYPKLAARLDKLLFTSDPEFTGPTMGADVVAEAVRTLVFPKKELTADQQLAKWTDIAEKIRGEVVETSTDETVWPLPKEYGDEYQGA